MKKTYVIVIFAAIFTFALGNSPAQAGYIVDFYSDDAEVVEYDDPEDNNDNVSSSIEDLFESEGDVDFNWIFILKEFESLDPIDMYFDVEASDGVTEYLIVEGIINSSDYTFTDYHVELGFEADDDDGFISLSDADALGLGLDFDTPDNDPAPRSFTIEEIGEGDLAFNTLFADVTHHEGAIWWEGGELPPFGEGDFSELDLAFFAYSIDVPDLDEEDYSFVIRQYPTIDSSTVVPEPASMLLFGTGMLGAFVRRRRRT